VGSAALAVGAAALNATTLATISLAKCIFSFATPR
jgi:hypothetical protein